MIYPAGLWKERLPHCLLWFTHSRLPSSRLGAYFPLWSGAAIYGEITTMPEDYFKGFIVTNEAKIMGIGCDYGSGSMYGSLR
jgi:hypothetical protein